MHVDVHLSSISALKRIVITILVLAASWPQLLFGDSFSERVQKIINSRRALIGVYVLDLENKKPLLAINSEKPLKPASVLKIATSFVALKELGPEYKFKTRILSTPINSGVVDLMVIKGEGAPDFTTESLWMLARQLKKLGIKRVKKISFDESSFENQKAREGQRAYESMSSALSFNFNSIAIEACPGRIGEDAKLTPDPWDLSVKIASSVKTAAGSEFLISVDELSGEQSQALSYKVSGKIGDRSPCRAVYRSINNPPRYFAASFVAFARLIGVEMPQELYFDERLPSSMERYALSSRVLGSIVQDLNHFSTNFLGEQILFALGVNQLGDSFNRDRGLIRISQILEGLGIPKDQFTIKDGSGLSHDNRLSTFGVVRILEAAQRVSSIRPEFEASLSVLGKSGTLKKRTPNIRGGVLRGKTGSLNGVSSLAGYLTTKGNRHLAFAIIHNDVTSKDNAEWVEDAIIEEMAGL